MTGDSTVWEGEK